MCVYAWFSSAVTHRLDERGVRKRSGTLWSIKCPVTPFTEKHHCEWLWQINSHTNSMNSKSLIFDPQHNVWGWHIQNVLVQMCVLAACSCRKDLLQYIYSESISDGFTKGYLLKSHSRWSNDACECVSEPLLVWVAQCVYLEVCWERSYGSGCL